MALGHSLEVDVAGAVADLFHPSPTRMQVVDMKALGIWEPLAVKVSLGRAGDGQRPC